MATKPSLKFTSPVVRLVSSGLYEPKTTDDKGQPLKVKTGPNMGQARQEYNFAIAIPKNPGEQHWAQNPWLRQFYDFGLAQYPNGEHQQPTFAWKIQDGDSTVPNKKMKKNCDREGYPGHWIMWLSGGTAPRIFNANGTQQLTDKDAIKPGYFVQVFGHCTDNRPSETPGLYMNHYMVAFSGIGKEITFGPDVAEAGFGQGVQLPPGVTPYTGQAIAPAGAIPVTGVPVPPGVAGFPTGPGNVPALAPVQPFAPAVAGMPVGAMASVPGVVNPVPLSPVGSVPTGSPLAPIAPVVQPLAVIPNPQVLSVPAPAAPRLVMTATAPHPYEAYINAGYTDIMLVQHGLAVMQ
jgi:hypothetical protein